MDLPQRHLRVDRRLQRLVCCAKHLWWVGCMAT